MTNIALSQRLRELIADSSALSDYLGCSVQAVNQFRNGTAYPKTENLIKIADYYDVSLDYLVGITNVPNRSAEIQTICDYIGLSEEVVFMLVVAKSSGISNVFEKAIKQTTDLICEIRGSTNDGTD